MQRDELNQISSAIIGATVEVHRHIGPGFLEAVYEEALCVEFQIRGITFARQVPVNLGYKGYQIGEGRLDLLVADQIIVELKAVESLMPIHTAQVMSYLKATHLELALLINFNVTLLKQGIRRIILS